jgi:predicted metal-dependent enzyme (double-stranded beta helix superfamily)
VPGWDPVELEGPEWLDGEKAMDDPEAGQEQLCHSINQTFLPLADFFYHAGSNHQTGGHACKFRGWF